MSLPVDRYSLTAHIVGQAPREERMNWTPIQRWWKFYVDVGDWNRYMSWPW